MVCFKDLWTMTKAQEINLVLGDSFKAIAELTQVGAVVTDPPYLISFMGRSWDTVPQEDLEEGVDVISNGAEAWHRSWLQLCFDNLPSGGLIKVFSATRTFHRLAAVMEQVGFVGVDLEAWAFGSGFPKSLNVSKAIDRHLGKSEEREVVGEVKRWGANASGGRGNQRGNAYQPTKKGEVKIDTVTASASSEAQRFEGVGTALKPAWEPFIVGKKP